MPSRAQNLTRDRRKAVGPKSKLTDPIKNEIHQRLFDQWSPVQISNDLKQKKIISISHETIYKYIYRDNRQRGKLFENLRRRHKCRRSWTATRNWKIGAAKPRDRNSISMRDPIVEERIRIGDYERDTMLGKNGRLLTIVDRTSRLTRLGLIKKTNGHETHFETMRLLEGEVVHTITNDHGSEFTLHTVTEKALGTRIYFAKPYCAWQRGTNENTNGLLRQYFPKGFDFSTVTLADIKRVEDLLNNRPRKCLGFKTPNEVHREKSQVLR